ncbi:uracil-DNA glycosylase [Candidatus Curtissbacteria bacterium RIFCSPHIGHO2_01_FULL_41_44]|uniref:Type-4 uracil-DNA glycosylase n=1 Tax=Candidatus Curtissbacteria bacterium RIFCSPLOWO2_01_FULL_42_50 TaxID=1797730 RepID=A0A1F5H3Q7_9BACT|nr:MAG: uracil-DNA glycosylase [Candidatus Curtissbacteria bacterium RIFCSPHIGHO2_01_FULL_41_44]OGD94657.1 MAG: uracil-DNA glycosylase [Candidatus Curtissbacteria bacterium RIFCSPHIGHO2_02_FULL_42_58]OGD98741.1 MAG: uracil-DNA glycosylase [Candidatus Curtissbacteria bacterium RIFCSPLOWO2_01_FULL_42_50]OGE02242.1 MAG: uracil-DNA glycosylase [Candidatus Curtissbacteria bacterium RIFCSPLOWO2_12_FULL_41_16]OGE10548.1 MAG: uracil-DNA glycosylase [Candidatus Curtissbacteria bacterium RIFCSPLOWO2_02_F
MAPNRTAQLKKIRDEIWNLSKSPLYKYRIKNKYFPVIGEGNHFAKIIFIGEAPGQREAETGRPFCGAAGKILGELLISIGLKREDVYITNVVKDRPPNNRDPEPVEIEIYSPFLDRQISIIKPKIIATLGRFSTKYILEKLNLPEKNGSITKLHGAVIDAKVPFGEVKIVPLYHPAVALYSAGSRKILEEDFKILKELI